MATLDDNGTTTTFVSICAQLFIIRRADCTSSLLVFELTMKCRNAGQKGKTLILFSLGFWRSIFNADCCLFSIFETTERPKSRLLETKSGSLNGFESKIQKYLIAFTVTLLRRQCNILRKLLLRRRLFFHSPLIVLL